MYTDFNQFQGYSNVKRAIEVAMVNRHMLLLLYETTGQKKFCEKVKGLYDNIEYINKDNLESYDLDFDGLVLNIGTDNNYKDKTAFPNKEEESFIVKKRVSLAQNRKIDYDLFTTDYYCKILLQKYMSTMDNNPDYESLISIAGSIYKLNNSKNPVVSLLEAIQYRNKLDEIICKVVIAELN